MGTMVNITNDSFQKIFLDFIRESFKENYNNYEHCFITKVGDAIVFSPQDFDIGSEKTKTLLGMFQEENEELKKKLSSYEKKEKAAEQKTENKKALFFVVDFNYSDRGRPVKLTDEQRKAIVWLITEFDLDVTIYRIDDSKIKEI